MNKGEIKLMGKKLNNSSTLINLYSNFQYIQCPTRSGKMIGNQVLRLLVFVTSLNGKFIPMEDWM